MFVSTVKDIFTFRACLFGNTLEISQMCLYILGAFAVSLAGMIFLYSGKR